MLHLETAYVEPDAQIGRTRRGTNIGYMGELFGYQPAIEGIETFYAMIFNRNVGHHEVDVGVCLVKELLQLGPSEHRDAQVGIALGQLFCSFSCFLVLFGFG